MDNGNKVVYIIGITSIIGMILAFLINANYFWITGCAIAILIGIEGDEKLRRVDNE